MKQWRLEEFRGLLSRNSESPLELHEDHEINVGVDVLQYARAGPRSRYLVASRNSNDPRVRAREPADHTANFSWLGVTWCEIPDDCRRSVNSPNIPGQKAFY